MSTRNEIRGAIAELERQEPRSIEEFDRREEELARLMRELRELTGV